MSGTKKQSINWRQLLAETVLVVFGLLLALWLNSWYQNRADHRVAMIALQGVVDEFSVNCALLKTHRDYHQAVVNGELEPEGIRVGLLRNDAWQSASATGAALNIEYRLASLIGSIHALQADHRATVRSYLDALFARIIVRDAIKAVHGEGERPVINELLTIQTALSEKYLEFRKMSNFLYQSELALSDFCDR